MSEDLTAVVAKAMGNGASHEAIKQHARDTARKESKRCHFDKGDEGHKPAAVQFDAQYPVNVCADCYTAGYKHCEGGRGFALIDLETGEHIEPWNNPDGYARVFPYEADGNGPF